MKTNKLFLSVLAGLCVTACSEKMPVPMDNVPVPDPVLDVQFRQDGSARDLTIYKLPVTAVKSPSLIVYENEFSESYVARFNNVAGADVTAGYFKADYKDKPRFRNAIADGHSLEAVFMLDADVEGKGEMKVFSSLQNGGSGLIVSNSSRGHRLTFLAYVNGANVWVESGIVPERGRYYHIVGVLDSENRKARIYVDGVLENEVEAFGTFSLPTDIKCQWYGIGADSGETGQSAWRGDVVTARVYGSALDGEQVSELWKRSDHAYPVNDIALEDILYFSAQEVSPSGYFRIIGNGFKAGDKVLWVDRKGYRAVTDCLANDGYADALVPDDISSGRYDFILKRGASLSPVGYADLSVVSDPEHIKAPKVIAHRAYHKNGNTENSLAAIKAAQTLGVYASEVDIWLTVDDVLMVHHDGVIGGKSIQSATSDELASVRLANGEPLPTLRSVLEQVAKEDKMKIIIEIKDHSDQTREIKAVDEAVKMVGELGLQDRTEYIAFDFETCRRVVADMPAAVVGYLSGDKGPSEVMAAGIKSVDYSLGVFKSKASWVKEAHKLGMIVNMWTVNTDADMLTAISLGADYITTDNPERLIDISANL